MKSLNYQPDYDCRFFRGEVPCRPHKEHGSVCRCEYFKLRGKKYLIIKLGARGDVIRTTPILRKIKEIDPNAVITWVTHYPDMVPKSWVDTILPLSAATLLIIQAQNFDEAYNFDKDLEACALLNLVNASHKKGFYLQNGIPAPIDEDSKHKYEIGIDDQLCKSDTWSYPQETFHMMGWKFNKEEYIMENPGEFLYKIPSLKLTDQLIGLNTGCGPRWKKRLWPEQSWVQLAKLLKQKGFNPILLGGPEEDDKNKRIASKSGALYLGTFSFSDFFSLMNRCSVIITAVSMAMHVAIALKKKLVLFVNVFPKEEFDLYGLGEIIQPKECCQNFYTDHCELPCMETISAEDVFQCFQKVIKG